MKELFKKTKNGFLFISKFYLNLLKTFFIQLYFSVKFLGIKNIRIKILSDDWGTSRYIAITKPITVNVDDILMISGSETQSKLVNASFVSDNMFDVTLAGIAKTYGWTKEQAEFQKESILNLKAADSSDFVVSCEINEVGKMRLFSGYHRFFTLKNKKQKTVKVVIFGGFIAPRFFFNNGLTKEQNRKLIEPRR
jgi:hypothetical protein